MNNEYRILVTTDLSDESLSAFDAAKNHAKLVGADKTHITGLTVLPSLAAHAFLESIDVDGEEIQEKMLKKSKERLDSLLDEYFPNYATSSIVLPGLDSAHTEISTYSNEQNIDLIVIASHGRSGVSRWVLGSVTDRVLRCSRCPVLVVPVNFQEN